MRRVAILCARIEMVCDGRFSISVRLLGLLGDDVVARRVSQLDSREHAVLRLEVNGLRGTDLPGGFSPGQPTSGANSRERLPSFNRPASRSPASKRAYPSPSRHRRHVVRPALASLRSSVT